MGLDGRTVILRIGNVVFLSGWSRFDRELLDQMYEAKDKEIEKLYKKARK